MANRWSTGDTLDHLLLRRECGKSCFDLRGYDSRLSCAVKDNLGIIRKLELRTPEIWHSGCVNSVDWTEDETTMLNYPGQYLLSASDDRYLSVQQVFSPISSSKSVWQGVTALRARTNHTSNIFSAKFLPLCGAREFVSCSRDGVVVLNSLLEGAKIKHLTFRAHKKNSYRVCVLAGSPDLIFTAGEDGFVRCYDKRDSGMFHTPMHDSTALIKTKSCAVTAFATNPVRRNELAASCIDGSIRLYDRRYLNDSSETGTTLPYAKWRFSTIQSSVPRRCTSLQFDPHNGDHLLASVLCDYLCLFDVSQLRRDVDKLSVWTGQPNSPTDEPHCQVKRLRIRGDWSDTGPDAPQHADQLLASQNNDAARLSQQPSSDRPHNRYLRQISDIMTRWMEDHARERRQEELRKEQEETEQKLAEQKRQQDAEAAAADMRQPQKSVPPSPSSSMKTETVSAADKVSSTASTMNMERIAAALAESAKEAATAEKDKSLNAFSNRTLLYEPVRRFAGHRSCRTMIKDACFWGRHHVLSGSDDGRIFIWNRFTGALVHILDNADAHVVNAVAVNPHWPVLASSGIDHCVKLWTPTRAHAAAYDFDHTRRVVNENARMLEETRDTMTVPASFFVRMMRMMSRSGLSSAASAAVAARQTATTGGGPNVSVDVVGAAASSQNSRVSSDAVDAPQQPLSNNVTSNSSDARPSVSNFAAVETVDNGVATAMEAARRLGINTEDEDANLMYDAHGDNAR